MQSGKVDKKTLFKKAVPFKENLRGRELDNYYDEGDYDAQEWTDYDQEVEDYAEENYGNNHIEDENYQRFDATTATSIKFNKCLALETQNYNFYMDNLIDAAQNGYLSSIRNYILFDVCQGNNCGGNWWSGKNSNLYMVDLSTFIEAAIAYGPALEAKTCAACWEFADICGKSGNYAYNQDQADDYQYGYDDGQRSRYLEGVNYQLFDRKTCNNECEAFNCWYDSEGDQEIDAESVEEWVLEINQCRQSENSYWNGLNLYSGWKCNDDGSGIELGVFIDPYCRMLQKRVTFSSIMDDNDYQYVFQSQDILPMMFDLKISCENTDNAQYVTSDTFYSENGGSVGNSNNISDLCDSIFNGDYAPRSLGHCGDQMNVTAEMIADAGNEGEYQNQNQGQNGNGQNMYQYMQSQQMLYNTYGRGDVDWQEYDISAQNVLSGAATCQAVANKYNGHSQSSRCHWWNGCDDGSHTLPWRNSSNAMSTPSARLTPLEIAWIVIAAVVATALFMHYTRKQIIKRKKRANENEKEVYQRTDDKGTALIIS